ncbi:MAG: STAS domain-containing protein [Bryobacteraceae bacterium]
MALTIGKRNEGNVEIMSLAGRLVLGEETSGLREQMVAAFDRKSDLLVDLAGLSYIDSAGLGELVGALASATSRGRSMKLLRPGRRMADLLQITKLYTTFDIFEDEAAALASYGK